MIVQFTAPLLDHSGYGEASRNTLLAMLSSGVKITTKIASFTPDKFGVGVAGKLALELENKYGDYNINLIELTPEHFPIFMEKGKYNIGYFFWEVKGVDKKWVQWCNLMDEIWLPSPIFVEIFEKAGIVKPIKIVPCCMDMQTDSFKPFNFPLKVKPKIIFYSIFQWTERKNPRALFEAYWKSFQGVDDVILMVKTYRNDFTKKEREAVKKNIADWKNELNLPSYPKTWLVLEDMTAEEILRMHKNGSIFVSAHRGEGWGYPQMAAMASGNPIISTNFGGIHEYLPKNTKFLIDYKFKNVSGMAHIPWYSGKQKWADVNTAALGRAMMYYYNDPARIKKEGQVMQNFVKEKFSCEAVGSRILKLLNNVFPKAGR